MTMHVRVGIAHVRTNRILLEDMEDAPMSMSLSSLRANLYRVVDDVLATGVPVEIARHGRKVRLVPDRPASKLSRLKKRKVLRCKPEELLNLDWSSQWKGHDLP